MSVATTNETLSLLRAAYRAMPKEKKNLLPLILVLRESCSHPLAALTTMEGMGPAGDDPSLSSDALERLQALRLGTSPGQARDD